MRSMGIGLALALSVFSAGCGQQSAEVEPEETEFTEEFWAANDGKADGLQRRGTLSGQAERMPWGGYYWSMRNGELVTGWNDAHGRSTFSAQDILRFDQCLADFSPACVQTINTMAGTEGTRLSPMMKFDYYVRQTLIAQYGQGGAPYTSYSHAAKWELDNHFINDNPNHPHYASAGYAGKCIGWALSTVDFDEPTRDVVLSGVRFRPGDIKGYLASIYNGAQFFVPEENFIGTSYREDEGDDESFKDVHPHDFVRALISTIGQGHILEGDLEPRDGVWNYPIYKFDLSWERKSQTRLAVSTTIYYVNDEVGMDEVFSTEAQRRDVLSRTLTFELTVPRNWSGDLSKATAGRYTRWTGESVDTHPDALITGLEEGWRKSIYDYRNTDMNKEVNYRLIKRLGSGRNQRVLIDALLSAYYASSGN